MATRHKSRKAWRRTLNWLGPVQRQRLAHNMWLELIVVGSLLLVGMATYEAVNVLTAHQHNTQRQAEALALAHTQIDSLQMSDGIAAGYQCFDGGGTPRSATDPGAPCNFSSNGKSNCLSHATSYCYTVSIAMASVPADAASQLSVLVTYNVRVSWSGRPIERGHVAMTYRISESSSMYLAEKTGRSGSGGSGTDATIGVANGVVGGIGTTQGGKFINTLADIPGGASVSITAATCTTTNGCMAPKTGYDLSGHFMISTNIPDKLISSCTWDFGDGTPVVQLSSGQIGCLDGQITSHSYADTWQMQPVPPYPSACAPPTGTSLDSHTFLANVTLHTTSGADISSVSPYYAVMPGCAS